MASPTPRPDEHAGQPTGMRMKRVGVVAGLAVSSNVAVPVLPDGGFADGAVEVVFDARDAETCTQAEGGTWYRVADGRVAKAFCREDGERVVIDLVEGDDVAVQVRRVVPFASALQGQVVLHAVGLEVGGRAAAFIGESGAGKSTLARALDGCGLSPLADDLLPCRVRDGHVCVPVGGTDGDRYLPLAAVAFLERERGSTRARRVPLAGSECLRALLLHGFGEMEAPPAWDAQFRLYGSLAAQATAFRLWVPDDLGLLPAVAKALVEDEIPAMLRPREQGP